MIDLNALKKVAIQAALDAGQYLVDNKTKTKKVFSEVGRDIKLEIDQSTEELIREKLSTTNIPVLGEEFGLDKDESLKWVVDPLDGTANYFRGLDKCCVSIALMQGAEALIGVIYDFNCDELYSAAQGNGAFLNDKEITVSDIATQSKATLTTGFPASESVDSSMKYLDAMTGWKKVRMFGSAALSCAYVAAGKCDCYAEKGVYLWDFAAGLCLIPEAGGKIEYNKLDNERYEVKFTNSHL